ncbi:MAG TPA: orotidine-5'-phosphate decarboxylase [Myxococcota bacterium]|nr:orotidine-5'-phosphate decarboxylase [Myxococcota bacterium]
MFIARLDAAISRCRAPAIVGLDPHLHRLPRPLRSRFEGLVGDAFRRAAAEAVLEWGVAVLDGIAGVVPATKPQIAFFEQLGSAGFAVLEVLCQEARRRDLIVLIDAKRGDIGSTAEGYARALLDDDGPLGADAITLSPYLGRDSIEPFIARCPDKGVFVLVRTSNPGGADLQDRDALRVAGWIRAWNEGYADLGPVGAVVGATVPEEAVALRAAMPKAMILVPGYGAQGGSARDTRPCFRDDQRGAIVNSARGVIFPAKGLEEAYDSDPGEVVRIQATAFARDLRENLHDS